MKGNTCLLIGKPQHNTSVLKLLIFFAWGNSPPSGPQPLHYRGFTITLRHTTVGRAPLDEWSALRRDLYLTTRNTHKSQNTTHWAGFVPAIPASEPPQAHALDHGATRKIINILHNNIFLLLRRNVHSKWHRTKVKCTLAQALRLCAGRTAHRGIEV